MGAAVDRLYEVFARYERPKWFEACACCWEGEVVAESGWRGTERGVVRVPSPGGDLPLRQVPAEALEGFVEDVMLTGGTVEVFKHYLPRLIEASEDVDLVILRMADVPDWAGAEWPAVVDALHALWLAGDGDLYLLSAISRVDPGIGWYLDNLPSGGLDTILRQAANRLLTKGRLPEGWWDRVRSPGRENYERVREWVLAQALAQREADPHAHEE